MSGHERISVLVADHDTWTRLTLCSMLDDAGFSVEQASNGVAALRIADITQPQIVLLRHNLPEVGAADVALSLKHDPRTRHCAVLQLEKLPCQPIALLAEVMNALEAQRAARASVSRRQAEVGLPIRSVNAAALGTWSLV